MKILFVLIFLLIRCEINAQNLTGIWKGQFTIIDKQNRFSKNVNNNFEFELQVQQLEDGLLKGVTYSYKVKEYYGKADFTGKIAKDLKTVEIEESKMVEVKKNEKTDVCIMKCTMRYFKNSIGNEILTGYFTSINSINNKSCYRGKVFLKKVLTTSFPKEAFLNKLFDNKVDTLRKKIMTVSNQIPIIDSQNKEITLKRHIENEIIINKNVNQIADAILPEILTKRDNRIIANIQVNTSNVKISFFDNGIVDNDTITVFVLPNKIIDKRRVSNIPITIDLKFSNPFQKFEIISTANNLGEIPPNTALMVITVNNKRIEIPIMSDNKTNAKVIIEYRPDNELTIQRF